MFIFLDDKRVPSMSHNMDRGIYNYSKSNKWFIVRSYKEFVEIVNSNFDVIELVSFDHDIDSFEDGIEMTGKDAANYLVEYCLEQSKRLPDWFVHSDNNNGNKNIRQLLLNYMFRHEGRLNRMVDAYGFINGNLIFTK